MEEVAVPELIGRTKERATEKLSNANLKVEVKEDYNDKAAGEVYDCSPAEGTKVAPGTTVTIYISKGPKKVETPVPTPAPENSETPDNNTSSEETPENKNESSNAGESGSESDTNTSESGSENDTNSGDSGNENAGGDTTTGEQ